MTFNLDTTITLPLVLSIVAMVLVWWRTRRSAIDERFVLVDRGFKAGSDRMDRHDLRLQALEQSVQAMPSREDLHSLQLELVRQTGSLSEMNAYMAGHAKIMERIEIIVSRHEDHLLGGGKSR